MKQTSLIKSTAMILIGGLFLFSCKDKDKVEMDANTTSDNSTSQSSFDDMGKVTEDALSGNNSYRVAAGGAPINCATVDTIVVNGNTKTMTINFPVTPTLCTDGKTRSGTITATLVGASYNTGGAVLTIVSANYTVNGHKLVGKRTETCVSSGVHDIVISDTSVAATGYASVISPTGTHQWKSTRRRTLTGGGGTLTIADNVYSIGIKPTVGNPVISGINRDGNSYTVDIDANHPLVVDFNCYQSTKVTFPTSGILTIHPSGKVDRQIDYGAGTCDNTITVTIAGKTYTVTL